MKKKLLFVMLALFTLAVIFPLPAVAMSGACDRFVSNVVVGSWHSISDAFACAAEDFGAFMDIIGAW